MLGLESILYTEDAFPMNRWDVTRVLQIRDTCIKQALRNDAAVYPNIPVTTVHPFQERQELSLQALCSQDEKQKRRHCPPAVLS